MPTGFVTSFVTVPVLTYLLSGAFILYVWSKTTRSLQSVFVDHVWNITASAFRSVALVLNKVMSFMKKEKSRPPDQEANMSQGSDLEAILNRY